MPDTRDIKAFVQALDPEGIEKFLRAIGQEGDSLEVVLELLDEPDIERDACDCVKRAFGVTILTAAERQEKIATDATEATLRQVAAAEQANEIAKAALGVAERSMFWTKVAGVVAVLAFLFSLISLFK